MEEVILSIDCGTQSLRVLLFSSTGVLLDREQVEYEPYFSKRPGWAEQRAEVFWKSLCWACQTIKTRQPEYFSRIKGVGVTTQRASMVNVDAQGKPLRPVIIWLDQRKAKPVYYPRFLEKYIYRLVGLSEGIAKIQADGKCNWIMQNQPEIWEKTHKYLQISGFLNYRLTGVFADSYASQIGHIPFNYKKVSWAKKGELPSKLFPIEEEKLPRLIAPGEQIGEISQNASRQTGLAKGTPVIACGSDKGCETIGMGVLDQRMASLSFGTTATIQTTSGKYFEALSFMPPYPAPIPGHFNPEVEIFRGFWMIRWFTREFAHKEVMEARERGVVPEQVLDDLLGDAPPGSMGLMVQPYWGPGLKTPSAKGAMIGFGDVHTKAHIYRAVIEGLAYDLLDGLHKLESKGRVKATQLAVSGGASQSNRICQISADIFNLPIVRGRTFETSGLGAAIITSVGTNLHESFESAIREMVVYETHFDPDIRNVSIYRQLYERVYLKIYKALAPLYREIRDITGYPE